MLLRSPDVSEALVQTMTAEAPALQVLQKLPHLHPSGD